MKLRHVTLVITLCGVLASIALLFTKKHMYISAWLIQLTGLAAMSFILPQGWIGRLTEKSDSSEAARKSGFVFSLFVVGAVLLSVTTCAQVADKLGHDDYDAARSVLWLSLLTLLVIAVSGYVFYRYDKIAIHRIFLILFGLFGVLYFVALPMYAVPDEPQHWLKILTLSNGHLLLKNQNQKTTHFDVTLPKGSIPGYSGISEKYSALFSKKNITQRMDYANPVPVALVNHMAIRPPVNYLFQLPGATLGKWLTNRTLVVMYMARFSAFVCSLLLLWLCIKYLPYRKMTFFMLAMTPMFLQEAISLAGDATTNTMVFVTVALATWCASSAVKTVDNKTMAIIAITAFVVGLTKSTYLPFILVFLLISRSKFGTTYRYRWFLFWAIGGPVLAACIWALLVSSYNLDVNLGKGAVAQSKAQIRYIFTYPWLYVDVLINTLTSYGSRVGTGEGLRFFFDTWLGASLGWYRIAINQEYLLYVFALCMALFVITERVEYMPYPRMQILLFFAAFASFVLVVTALYACCTLVGNKAALGLQGRYFIPTVLVLTFCINCPTLQHRLNAKSIFRYTLLLLSFIHLRALSVIVVFYAG
jgi:uncharacterized membrane protein